MSSWERDEANWARYEAERANTLGPCHRHHWQATKWGGICTTCGETVDREDF